MLVQGSSDLGSGVRERDHLHDHLGNHDYLRLPAEHPIIEIDIGCRRLLMLSLLVVLLLAYGSPERFKVDSWTTPGQESHW